MKIVTPLSKIDYYEPLIEAGADEFFCGVLPYQWVKEYSSCLAINRRETLFNANVPTFSSMEILQKMIDEYKIPVKITFNALCYNPNQYTVLIDIIKRLIDIGFDTFIIADIALILYLRQNNIDCRIHLSGECAELNSLSIKFFNKFNISRYVFHRKNSLEDMRECIKNNDRNDAEYEAFILNELCSYTGAFCNSLHCNELAGACEIPHRISKIDPNSTKFKAASRMLDLKSSIINEPSNPDNAEKNEKMIKKFTGLGGTGCGLCRILEMKNFGVTHLKVVGRGKALEPLLNDIRCVKEIIGLADEESNNDAFIKKVKEKYFNNSCPPRCYYI